jgi:hypothetical protein
MRPLLWKEFRELRAVLLLAAVGFPACLGLLQVPGMADHVVRRLSMFTWAAMISAVALGAGQIVSERSAKTLDYLFGRPVAGKQVVLAKFMAGSTVLLALVGLLLALVFLGEGVSEDLLVAATQLGYVRTLVYQFPMYWFLYSCTLLFSSIVEQRAQAIAGGLSCLLAFLAVALTAPSRWPLLALDVWFPAALLSPTWFELTLGTSLWIAVAAVWSVLAILVAALAALILERRWEMRLNWPVIGLLFIVIGVGPSFVGAPAVEVQPAGVYSLQTLAGSGPVADGSRVSVAVEDGLLVIDFSDAAHPRQFGQFRLPLWSIMHRRIAGDDVYVVGRHKDLPVDTAGVLRVSMRAAGMLDAAQIVNLGPWDSQAWIGEPYVIGRHLYLGTAAGEDSRLRVFDLSTDGPARQTADLTIEHWPVGPRSNMFYGGVPPFTLAIRGRYAYVAGYSQLLTLDLGDPSNPRVVHRMEFKDAEVVVRGGERQIASIGNRLYVQVFQPPMLRRYDLQDPARPVEIGRSIWRPRLEGALVADEARSMLFVAWRDGVLAFPPPESLWIRDVRYLKGKIDPAKRQWAQSAAAAGGFFYVLIDGRQVAAYPVPR